jgi:hypothetical protein
VVTLNMHVRRFVVLVAVEEESVRSNPSDDRHRRIVSEALLESSPAENEPTVTSALLFHSLSIRALLSPFFFADESAKSFANRSKKLRKATSAFLSNSGGDGCVNLRGNPAEIRRNSSFTAV